jgi:4-amino-4-deoxy-L-arabinose transferase-like glycosyltransferase
MKNLLSRVSWSGWIALLAALLYMALLVGRDGLGGAYMPVVLVSSSAIIALVSRWLWVEKGLRIRLRVDVPALLLGGLLLSALGLRLFLRPKAIPVPGTDEAFFVQAALEILRTGKYIPPSLRHPTLLVYVELGSSVLRFLAGASSNLWTWPTELVAEHLYGWGRGAVALLGAASLVPIYYIGRERYGRRVGFLAALFLGLLPMHVTASGTISPAVPTAFLCVLAVLFSQRLIEEALPWRISRWALAAGVCAGLAAATHYLGALVLLVPLVALLLRPAAVPFPGGAMLQRWPGVLLTLVGALGAFVIACPAVILDLDRLMVGLSDATRAYFPADGHAGTGLWYLLQEGLSYGLALLALIGGILLAPRVRRQDVLLFLFPASIYLALLVPRTRFPQDLVLLAPWLALLSAIGVDRLCSWTENRWPDRRILHRWLPWGLALLGGGLALLAV